MTLPWSAKRLSSAKGNTEQELCGGGGKKLCKTLSRTTGVQHVEFAGANWRFPNLWRVVADFWKHHPRLFAMFFGNSFCEELLIGNFGVNHTLDGKSPRRSGSRRHGRGGRSLFCRSAWGICLTYGDLGGGLDRHNNMQP